MALNLVLTLNAIRQNASALYQERIPVATKTNLEAIATNIAQYQSTQNEFLNLLVNRIAMVIVNQKKIDNPLAMLKKGKKPMGKDIEELFVNPAISKEYKYDSQDLLKVTPPDVKALYYGINRQDKYPVTISQPTLMKALTDEGQLNSLVSAIVNSLYSGDNLDEFMLMKQMVGLAVTKDHVKKDPLSFRPDNMTETNAKELIKKLRAYSLNFTFPSSNYNSYDVVKPVGDTGKSVITYTPVKDQVLLIDSTVYSSINVDVLASAFNMDKTDFMGKVIPVDGFNGEPIIAMLCDEAWFRVYDDVYRTADMFNGDTLNHSYWLHHWQVLSYSMFANAVAFTYTPEVTG